MKTEPYNLVFIVGFVIYMLIRGEFKKQTKNNELSVMRVDSVERTLLALSIPGILLLPLIYLFTPWFSFADYNLPRFAPCVGAVLMIMALWLFWRSHVDLGINWSQTLELRNGHQLIRSGIYKSIRHPMYASIWLWCLSQGLLLENWFAGWYALLAFALMYFIRIPREEQMMCEFFGNEYRDYMRQTGRLFPRIHTKNA